MVALNAGLGYNIDMPFQKGHPPFKGIEKGWFKKGFTPWSKSQKGIHLSPATEFKKGQKAWNKGMEMPKEEKSNNWRGDNVGYGGVHQWLYRNYGKASECIDCRSKEDIEWANISGKYLRDIIDWKQLCLPCHRKFDNWSQKMWKTRRKNQKRVL